MARRRPDRERRPRQSLEVGGGRPLDRHRAKLAEELWQHKRRTAFQGKDERVFCHPERGTVFRANVFGPALRSAMKAAGVDGADQIRPYHDLRHSSLTNGAASGEGEIALMARAGHASMNTTKTYLHLAGRVFRDEAERLEQRLLGGLSTDSLPDSENLSAPEPTEATEESRIPA